MPYDSSMDECLFTESRETDTDRLTVSVYSYNGGVKKLQITREGRNSEGAFRFAKLGRMTKDEVEAVLPLMQKATGSMN